MSIFCNPSCLLPQSQFSSINACDLAAAMRSGEIVKAIFITCDVLVDDITDETEIQSYKTANKLVPTLLGRGKIDEKTNEGIVRIGCQNVATISKYPFEYESELVDTTSGSEADVYNDLNNNKLNLTIAFLTCDNWLLVNPNYSAGGQLGLKIDELNISPIWGGEANGQMKYVIKGAVSEKQIIKSIKLTDAVAAKF